MKNPLSQKILFLKIQNQDPDAYAQFYDLYVEKIYRFIFFKVNTTHDAQDLTSEVFLKLWQTIKGGKQIRNLNAFIYMVARNTVIDFYRQKNREDLSTQDIEQTQVTDARIELVEHQVKNQGLDQIGQGLKNLKDEYREVVVLRFMDELSIGEIAQVLGKSQGAVRVLIHRALKALKENISHSHND